MKYVLFAMSKFFIFCAIANSQVTEIIDITPEILKEDMRNYQNPQLSPNGAFLTYEIREVDKIITRLLDVAESKIYLLRRSENSNGMWDDSETEVEFHSHSSCWPQFNTERRRLKFTLFGQNEYGESRIYQPGAMYVLEGALLTEIDSLVSRRIKNPGFPSYSFNKNSRDKYDIVLTNRSENICLAIISSDQVTDLTSPSPIEFDYGAKYAPDTSRRIIFIRGVCEDIRESSVVEAPGQGDIWILNGTESSYLTGDPMSNETHVEWSPDAKFISFYSVSSEEPNITRLYIAEVNNPASWILIDNSVVRGSDEYRGAQWLSKYLIAFVKWDPKEKNPIYVYDKRVGKSERINTGTYFNSDLNVRRIDDNWVKMVLSATSNDSHSKIPWSLIYYFDLHVK